MRRQPLAPPRHLRLTVDALGLLAGVGGGPAVKPVPLQAAVLPARGGRHRMLGRPETARPHPRRFFDPVRGWVRRTERAMNVLLSRWFFTGVPGIHRIYAWQLRRGPVVSEAEIPVAGLRSPFDGARVLLLTDIHGGPFLSPAALQETLRRLGDLHPDLVLLGGDLATTRVADFEPFVPVFGALRAPLGVFGVLGNHDHYTEDTDRLRRLMAAGGIELLENRSVRLQRGGAGLRLAGIDDWNAGAPDLDAALAACDGEPVILLSHNPDAFFEAARRGVPLVLSGHTHGGQIRLPGLPVLVRMSRYRLDEGRYRAAGSELVVSRGLGVSGVPLRLGCPPEAVLITLRQPTPSA